MNILITSGGTKIMLDSVRHIGNMSKGTFGSDICKNFLKKGHTVDFLMAEESKTPFEFKFNGKEILEDFGSFYDLNTDFFGFTANERMKAWLEFIQRHSCHYNEFKYKTFEDYKKLIETLLSTNSYDMVILAAAVSDFGVEEVVNGKIRSKNDMDIKLKALPKIISSIKTIQPNTFLVGFKLLVDSTEEELVNDAESSIEKNGCDVVVANDLRDIKNNNHKLLIVSREEDRNKNKYFMVTRRTKDESERNFLTLAESLVDSLCDSWNRNKRKIV